ncbi:Sporulation kinase A [compost metagenome]
MEIMDQGGGIKEEFLEKLGTPFFSTKASGTGLGLSVCYGIAERHNAVIKVQTSSRGTSFFVQFNLQG